MSAATEEFGKADVRAFELIRDYLVENYDWDPYDIDIKYNDPNDGYRTLGVEDFVDLEDYGVIVILAHAISRPAPAADTPDPFNFGFKVADMGEHYYYIQVAAAQTYQTGSGWTDPYDFGFKRIAKSIDLEAERETGRVIVVSRVDVFKKTETKYLYMREDLWRENLGSLPRSFVYLVAANASFLDLEDAIGPEPNSSDPFNLGFKAIDVFESGLGSFMAWDDLVDTQTALDAVWIIPWMAYKNWSDVMAWQSGEIPVYAVGADPEPADDASNWDPYGLEFKAIAKEGGWEANLDLWPFAGGTTRHLYLPTWLTVGTFGVPEQTVTTRVTIEYTDPNFPPPDPNVLQDLPHVAKEFDGLIPGREVSIKMEALDLDENVLIDGSKTLTLKCGENLVTFKLAEYGIEMEADPPVSLFDPGEEGSVTITATLRYFKEEDNGITPTGGPVVGMELEFNLFSGSPAEVIGSTTAVTDPNGQASVTLTADHSGSATVGVLTKPDQQGATGACMFKMRPPDPIPGIVTGECDCDPEANHGGHRVWVEFDRLTDPEPLDYNVFGYNFYDKDYYGYWYDQKIELTYPVVTVVGDRIRVGLTSGGGSSDCQSASDPDLQEGLQDALDRFEGGIWLITPRYE